MSYKKGDLVGPAPGALSAWPDPPWTVRQAVDGRVEVTFREPLHGTSVGAGGTHLFVPWGAKEKPRREPPSPWNAACPRCGSPAYQGFVEVECSRSCSPEVTRRGPPPPPPEPSKADFSDGAVYASRTLTGASLPAWEPVKADLSNVKLGDMVRWPAGSLNSKLHYQGTVVAVSRPPQNPRLLVGRGFGHVDLGGHLPGVEVYAGP